MPPYIVIPVSPKNPIWVSPNIHKYLLETNQSALIPVCHFVSVYVFKLMNNLSLSLTVTDSDGATNSTQATLSVNKAKDYRPVANAGPNQV